MLTRFIPTGYGISAIELSESTFHRQFREHPRTSVQYSSSGALALAGHPGIAAVPLHFGGRASGVYSNPEHGNESTFIHCLRSTLHRLSRLGLSLIGQLENCLQGLTLSGGLLSLKTANALSNQSIDGKLACPIYQKEKEGRGIKGR
jgi:hypothetical protein